MLSTRPLKVADSSDGKPDNKLSADQLKEYLRASCAFSSSVLGVIQGPGASQDPSDPRLFELFCNSAFQFRYPTGASLFSKVSSYAYALQFQLGFLYSMCGNIGVKCGWNNCTYGKEMNPKASDNSLQSHICQGFKCSEPSSCKHTKGSSQCNHNKYGESEGCGKGSKPSPLQAFITGAIPSFSLSTSSTPNHMSDHPQGALCHVPMGFQANHLRSIGNGARVYLVLNPICGNFSSPLRQLCEKLGCLTKRTPRSLGDLFGFMWHLNGQLFKTRPKMNELAKKLVECLSQKNPHQVPSFFMNILNDVARNASAPGVGAATSTGLSLSLESMAPAIPFLYQLFMVKDTDFLPSLLFDLTQYCHKWETGNSGNRITLVHKDHSGQPCSTINDLWSLYQPVSAPPRSGTDPYKDCRDQNCGGYLYPLTHSEGSTYAPKHASTYLSWVLYLSDDLQSWFQDMLDEFKDIDCSKSGCKSCNQNHGSGSSTCSCTSIVHCGGALPVLYRHGFQFYSPHSLSGAIGGTNTKRNCKAFADQLQSVLAEGAPLTNLLTRIDDLLYMFRFYFCYNLSTFWIMYVCVIFYKLFFLLDTLHVRSHLKLTASHVVPPLTLLTTGKPLPVTKLNYYMP
ncbi:extracellular matrix-binding ebh [Babesia caballi]|uniref:Extracellular matrix-binding ebh n=1 Tax=Babesia caballi TaxID=5871 RepID=A0AAV4LN36_BABCB|nr:extracellular matrix-binding ebh [Babesia caballi]